MTRTPAIRDALGASTAEMGLLLFGISIGSMSGILSSAPLVRRFGTKTVIRNGLGLLTLGMVVLAFGTGSEFAPLVLAGFMMFGAGIGSAEVAINLEGAEVEQLTQAPVLVELHGFFSAGTLLGALLGIGLTTMDIAVMPSLLGVVVISIPALIWALRGIEPGMGKTGEGSADVQATEREDAVRGDPEEKPVWKDPRLWMIAVILLSFALAEGSATDWLALLMVDGFDLPESSGALVFAGFAATMTIGRFGGRALLMKFGRVAVLRGGAILAMVGVSAVIFADSPVLAGISVTLWGFGVSLGFPVAIAAASDSGPDSVARVSLVATAGYVAFLVGPPLLGFLGEHFGLRSAMIVVLAVLTVAAVLASATGPRAADAAESSG
ncbi:MAG: MFS transporter [Solirubrobacterales bacterium]|nr:MFS transporter [Solirubrobacterales bacterium]